MEIFVGASDAEGLRAAVRVELAVEVVDVGLDWRAVIDARARLLEGGSLHRLLDALANAR